MAQPISKRHLTQLTSLTLKKYRHQNTEFLIEGLKLCREVLTSDFNLRALYYCPEVFKPESASQLLAAVAQRGIEIFEITPAQLKLLTTLTTSQGVLGRVEIRPYRLSELQFPARALVIAVAQLNDPGNLGTIIRTADWFGASAVLCDCSSVEWLNPKVVRASMGSFFHVPILSEIDLLEVIPWFQAHHFGIFGATLTGSPITAAHLEIPRKLLILGSEAHGLTAELAAAIEYPVTIPGFGRAESLNVAIAAGILLYQFQTAAFGGHLQRSL
ncbi:RNA methyltransferase [candidate division KSB1 bacterium]|nr:RNA methyltransferase [candidate division KSB1 bacterium]